MRRCFWCGADISLRLRSALYCKPCADLSADLSSKAADMRRRLE